jgi:SEC-C motif-containing protein
MHPLVEALSRPYPCGCDCFHTLSDAERVQGIAALFRFDDALRGWRYEPIYRPGADRLYREAQARNDAGYRGIAVRDEACTYRRLVGFAVHELIHALDGDPTQANYGLPFGLPYGVPTDLPYQEEKRWLDRFNRSEARAWVGIPAVSRRFFGIGWTLRTARDVGTYGFVGGNARVDVPPGFRPVIHIDRAGDPERYYPLARRIEEEELGWFTDQRLEELYARFSDAEAAGRARREEPFPAPEALASIAPRRPGRNDLCPCGSGRKHKRCCGRT